MKLGLDELMIVNPGAGDFAAESPETGASPNGLGRFFLGADGSLYQVQGVESAALEGSDEPVGGFFLGDDGTRTR